MTLPKGHGRSSETRKGLRPSSQELSSPVVDWKMLKIPVYRAEVVSDSAGKPNKKVKNVEIHPIEWDAQIVLSGGRAIATLPIDQVRDVSIVSMPKGIIKKKEVLAVKISFTGNGTLEHWIIINIDDRYINEFLDHVEKLRQKESDESYWIHRLLTFQTDPVGQARVVDIYPLTPFLAEGERVVWQNMKVDPADKDKIVEVDLVTNYRVFQYNYDSHTGTAILLPAIEDVAAVNVRTHAFSKKLLGTDSKQMGDIILTAEERPFLRLLQVSDPDSLVSLIKSVQEELRNIKVSGGPNLKESDIVINRLADEPIKVHPVTSNSSSLPVRKEPPFKGGGPPQIRHNRFDDKKKSISITMGMTCRQCSKVNPTGSKFCNKCGSMLPSYCQKCGNSKNAADAVYCNQCGWIIGIAEVNELSHESIQHPIVEDDFLECILAEYDLKINYPATWTKMDTDLPRTIVTIFLSQVENASDSFREYVALQVVDVASDMTLEAWRDDTVRALRESNSDLVLHESVSTTIAGIPAWQLVYTSSGLRSLQVFVARRDQIYTIIYLSQPEKYFKFLSIIEQMISSIEFLS